MSGTYRESFDDTSNAAETEILGGTNQTKIGNVSDALKVNISNTSIPTKDFITNQTRVEWTNDAVIYNGASYTAFYSYSGSGYLHNVHIDANTNNAVLRVVADSVELFTIPIKFITDTGIDSLSVGGGISFDAAGNTMTVSFNLPLKFTSSISIQIGRQSTSMLGIITLGGNVTLNRYLVCLSKEL